MQQIYIRCFIATALPIIGYLYPNTAVIAGASLAVALILFCGSMFGVLHSCCASDDKAPINLEDFLAVCLDLFGTYYIGLGFAFGISTLVQAPYVTLCILFSNWASDAFALFFGKNFGRGKLIPRLSPNKTVEGGFGAILGAVVLAATVHTVLIFVPSWQSVLGITHLPTFQTFVWNGLLLGVLGIIGDLVESYMKRVAGVKDSGEFFRAHGGVLDRVDGLIFSFPIMHFVWWFGLF
jgi:phosphatidate cytidylyltransferase